MTTYIYVGHRLWLEFIDSCDKITWWPNNFSDDFDHLLICTNFRLGDTRLYMF